MKFYDRKSELEELNKLFEQTTNSARMTVITGRRRVGKTLLSLEFAKGRKYVYLFVAKKSESLLCAEYLEEIKRLFEIPVIGEIHSFKDIFELLLSLAKNEPFTLIVDEFQEFYNINAAIYSEIQKLWDLNKSKCRLNLIFVGSVYSLMYKIFQNSKEPLFNRADRILSIQPFSIKTMNTILKDYSVNDIETLFAFYIFTGGMPKYMDMLVENKAFTSQKAIDFIVKENSPFLHEGKNLLIEEFGKDYGTYFSILELISVGKTARSEIESILERNAGGYLDRLESDYAIIAKYKPIDAKPNSRSQKYKIIDNFLNFWFCFLYRHRSAIETGNYDYVKDIIGRDFNTYCGKLLERFFQQLFAESKKYNSIGSYWRKGNLDEIDLVAINDMKKEIAIAEVKMNKERINVENLKKKSQKLLTHYPDYKGQWLGLSLEDAKNYLSD